MNLPSYRKKMECGKDQYTSLAGGLRVPPNPYGGQYVVMSPVLIPLVPPTARYVKSKVRRGKKYPPPPPPAPASVRYVPTLTYATIQPNYVYYDARSSYSVAVSQEAMAQKYNSTSPCSTFSSAAANSELNPLSRPYTPSNFNRQTSNLPVHSAGDLEKPQSPAVDPCLSNSSVWSDISSDPTTVCPDCCEKKGGSMSDNDSGVGGDSEDEAWCNCDSDSLNYLEDSDDSCCDDLFEQLGKGKPEDLPLSTSSLIDFLCGCLAPHEWRTVARELGVNDVIIQDADYNEFESAKEKMRAVFAFWAASTNADDFELQTEAIAAALTEIGRLDYVSQLKELTGESMT